jgi:protein-disulfide isomerase
VTVSEPAPADGPEPGSPRGRRYVVQIVIGVVVLAVAAIVIAVILGTQHTASTRLATTAKVGPKNMASYGVLLTGGDGRIAATRTPAMKIGHSTPTNTSAHADTVNIVEYIDFQCPVCLGFEKANLANTAALVAAGKATLEIHPISILDRSSLGTRYSSRAANAAACVANFDPDSFLDATAALYEYQPTEGTAGLSNGQILTVLGKADVSGAAITTCVDKETYRDWVSATTAAVEAGTFEHVATAPTSFVGTPTVFVNGVQYGGSIADAAAFTAFVTAQTVG